jgi:lantibiotic modifying enzyme
VSAAPRLVWGPILDGVVREDAVRAVLDIAAALAAPPSSDGDGPYPSNRADVPGGAAGLALFYTYLAETELGDSAGFADAAGRYLESAIEALAHEPMMEALHGGFSGIAWVVEHLKGWLFEPEEEDLNAAIDGALLQRVSQTPWNGDYDLIIGLVGLGVYALDRLPGATARRCVEEIVARLAELAERQGSGLTWFTAPERLPEHQRVHHPNGYYNLGLAHGAPGVIGFLADTCAAGVAVERARPLLDGAVAWLLTQRQPEAVGSTFAWALAAGDPPTDCRSAWCYGDPGAATTLLLAAQTVGDASWERAARDIALRSARRARDKAGVVDAGLCHGGAGLAHVLNRQYHLTGEPELLAVARHWFEATLAMRKPGTGVGGFLAYTPNDRGQPEWTAERGFLTGAAGVGLALLGAATPLEPAWDRILQLSPYRLPTSA